MTVRIFGFATLMLLASAAGGADGGDWIAKIRRDHPRMFFNRDTWPTVKARTLSDPAVRARYEQLLRTCEGYPTAPVCSGMGPVTTPPSTPIPPVREWGVAAARCAFAWRMTGDRRHLDKAREMLRVSVAAYQEAYRNRRAVHWYSTNRILALCAYDWIYEGLSDAERRAIIVPFLQYVADIQPGPGKPFVTRRNGGGPETGFYGVSSLLWYAGLAAFGDGHCDELARQHLERGYALCRKMLAYRDRSASDDGGLSTGVPDYSAGAYPWAHFNFFHTWRSATGENLAREYPHMALFMNWFWWNWIPSRDPKHPFCHGFGDDQHEQNFLPVEYLYEHATQYMNFFRDIDPDAARLAATLRTMAPNDTLGSNWFIYPFILPTDGVEPFSLAELEAKMPKARHFEYLGQTFMCSGRRTDSTYCLFTAGARTTTHKHWDENNFVIFKHDFLALDSGSRGLETDAQLAHYYAQTVAHNCVLVHRPGEPMPPHWGPVSDRPEAKIGHGGQVHGSAKMLAFSTNPLFSYVAADAAPVYQGKASAVVRQFIHVQPDFFVVYDRVDATDSAYRKEWLLHTENEPVVDRTCVRADCGKGRLFCETLLPEGAQLAKVGGPGREYWASGLNWELDPVFVKGATARAKALGVGTYFGKWRIEVSPVEPAKEDRFLHVLTAADTTCEKPVQAVRVEEDGRDGVVLTLPDGMLDGKKGRLTVTCLFNRIGAVGGVVRCCLADASGETVSRQDFKLDNIVQPQTGVFPSRP